VPFGEQHLELQPCDCYIRAAKDHIVENFTPKSFMSNPASKAQADLIQMAPFLWGVPGNEW
jgi:hypothetical protein